MTFETQLAESLRKYSRTVVEEYFKIAVEAGSQVLLEEYQAILRRQEAKPGSKNAVHAPEGMGMKSGVFKDGTGAWGIVGAKTRGGKMLAPQLRFGEHGTLQRETKDHQNRGSTPAQRWLSRTMASSMAAAVHRMKERLSQLVH